jgi:hypothetical protein
MLESLRELRCAVGIERSALVLLLASCVSQIASA